MSNYSSGVRQMLQRIRGCRFAVLTTIALVGGLFVASPAASADPALVATSTTTARVSPNSTTALAGLSVTGDTFNTLQATLATDLGTLSITTTTGLTLGYNNAWSGTQSITFTGSQAAINTALSSASIITGATTGTAHVAVTAMVAQPGYYYLASNQHFYSYVSAAAGGWFQADAGARALSFNGQPGYLATIPNATVNTFISNRIANATNVWFGARAYENVATDGTQGLATVGASTYRRVWRWTAGANQSPIAGGVISECSNATGPCSFENAGNFYSAWDTSEPNNNAGSNTTAYIGEYVGVTNWNGTSGAWNDLSPTDSNGVSGYVVEYGGLTNSDPSLGTGFSGVITATSNVLVANAPTAPAAPAITGVAGDGAATLSWIPASDGGATITSYQASVNGGSWADVTTSSSSATVNGNVVITLSATVGGLTNGSSTGLQIRAVNSVGPGVASNTVTLTPAGLPTVPTGVSATRGNASATVAFSAATANGSAISGYTATSSPGGVTATCSASPCVVTGLTNGTAYTFTVHATNGVGDGAESAASAAVTPATVPAAPTGVNAARGNGQATVSFTASPNSGGSASTGYLVTSSPGGFTASCSASPCVVTGLTNGTAYTFTVVATNAVGASPSSSASAATTPATVPDAPTAADATRSNGQASVAFTAPVGNGGAAITGYAATSSPGGVTATCSASPCVVTGLTNGTAYTFTVVATNAVGDSVASSPTGAVTPATVPGAPTAVTAVRGDGQVTVGWTAPASDGGSAIGDYTVTSSPGGLTATCTTSPCVVTGLTNGTAYTFTVVATNVIGTGAASTASASATPAAPPGTPTSFAVQRGDASAVLTFGAPTNNGAAITGYEVSTDGGTTWAALTTTGTTTRTATVTGLTNGTTYDFEVRAVNAVGAGSIAGPLSATPATVPDAPTSVAATSGNGQASVAFTAPASGGSVITGYAVTSSPGGFTAVCTTSPCVVNGLTNGAAYTFTAIATNAVGDSAASAPSASVIPATVPLAPTAVTGTRGDRSIVLTWTAPVVTGGDAIDGYVATASPGGAAVLCQASPCTIVGLANGVAYSFTVAAVNGAGSSAASTASAAAVPAGVPRAPAALAVTRGDATLVLDFDAAAANGEAVSGYEVSLDGGATWSPLATTAAAARSLATGSVAAQALSLRGRVAGLINGSTYRVMVRAVNAIGVGEASSVVSGVPAAAPQPVGAITVLNHGSSATITFATPAANGAAVDGYQITILPGGRTVSCAVSPCEVAGLTSGTAYAFTVRALSAAGESVESAPVFMAPAERSAADGSPVAPDAADRRDTGGNGPGSELAFSGGSAVPPLSGAVMALILGAVLVTMMRRRRNRGPHSIR